MLSQQHNDTLMNKVCTDFHVALGEARRAKPGRGLGLCWVERGAEQTLWISFLDDKDRKLNPFKPERRACPVADPTRSSVMSFFAGEAV